MECRSHVCTSGLNPASPNYSTSMLDARIVIPLRRSVRVDVVECPRGSRHSAPPFLASGENALAKIGCVVKEFFNTSSTWRGRRQPRTPQPRSPPLPIAPPESPLRCRIKLPHPSLQALISRKALRRANLAVHQLGHRIRRWPRRLTQQAISASAAVAVETPHTKKASP